MIVFTGDAHIASNPNQTREKSLGQEEKLLGATRQRDPTRAPWGAEQSEGRTVLVVSTEALLI